MIDYDRLHFLALRMHLWIFKTAVDEKEAYDEIGLTDEENAELGYCGQIVLGKTTNYDRVRSMTIDEMADWIAEHDLTCATRGCLTRQGYLEWLKQEVDE